MLMNR